MHCEGREVTLQGELFWSSCVRNCTGMSTIVLVKYSYGLSAMLGGKVHGASVRF